MRLSDRIRTARLRMDWNQSELAAVLKVDRSAVGHWERGEGSKPSTARLIALAGLTGVCVEWLAMGTGPMVPAGDASAAGQFSADELRLVQEYRRRDGGARALIVNLADPLLPPPRKQDARWIDRGLKRGWADGSQAKGAGFQLYGGLSMPAALRASFSLFARAPGARSRWNDELRGFWLTPAPFGFSCHCEERSDAAIQTVLRIKALDCFAALAMTPWFGLHRAPQPPIILCHSGL